MVNRISRKRSGLRWEEKNAKDKGGKGAKVGRKEEKEGTVVSVVTTADAEANRSSANSTWSRSIIVAESAVIMLDILIRGNSRGKLDLSRRSASSSAPLFSLPFSLQPFYTPTTPILSLPPSIYHLHLYRDDGDPVTVSTRVSPVDGDPSAAR